MNVFTEQLFIFIFLFALIYFKMPDISDDNYIYHKFMLFVSSFAFYFVIQVISKIRNNCKTDTSEMLRKSMEVAVSTIIGYSVFVDLTIMQSTRDFMTSIIQQSDYNKYLMACIITILFITIIRAIQLLFNNKAYQCN